MNNNNTIQNTWKGKAMLRRLQNKILKSRVKELTDSRDKWKEKAQKYQQQCNETNEKLKSIEQVLKKN